MKARGNNRQKNKKSKSAENLRHPSRHRAHSLPPTTSSTPVHDATPPMDSQLYTHGSVCSHGNDIPHLADRFKVSHNYDTPVEVHDPLNHPSPEERNILVQEMETEFKNLRKIIISGLPPESNNENLTGFFNEFSCRPVSKVKDGLVRVVFPTHEATSKALTLINSTILNYHQITATYGRPDSLLFVGNLPLTYTREDLSNLFSPHGDILRCLVVCGPVTGLKKGYGFVEYSKREEALLAKEHLATKVVGLRSLRVDFADHGMQTCRELQSETLFVDRLQRGFQDGEKLRELFSKYGTVNFCQVAVAAGTGVSRGFAFVDMSSSQEAELAQLSCNGSLFRSQEIRVSFGMPCRHGASILQHKSSVLHVTCRSVPPLTCTSTSSPQDNMYLHPYSPYYHFSRGMLMHSQSEESLGATPMKPHPLRDTTNTESGFYLHHKGESLTQLLGPPPPPPPLLQQCCMGHSFSTPSLIHVGSHPPPPHITHSPPPLPPLPPSPLDMDDHTPSSPDDHMITWGHTDIITHDNDVPLQDRDFHPWIGGREEESEESPMPSILITVTDCSNNSMLGKRCASGEQPLPLQEVWPDGVYDQVYIGQHQQGIPYTHPLKRIKMEQ